MLLASVVEKKDVIVALLGASAGLAGLVLVFLGLVASSTSSFEPGTKPAIVSLEPRSNSSPAMTGALRGIPGPLSVAIGTPGDPSVWPTEGLSPLVRGVQMPSS